MKLLPDWRQAWRWWSVRVSALGALLAALALFLPDVVTAVWNALPPELVGRLPLNVAMIVPFALEIAAIVARILQQRPGGAGGLSLWRSRAGQAKGNAGIAAAVIGMIAGVIAIEGGYVNHPADPGGETNMGITRSVAIANGYAGPMRTLPREVATSIYYQRYLVAPGFAPLADVDAAVTEELFDTAVNMGAPRPSRWFQQSINNLCAADLVVDGRVGRSTIAAYAGCQHQTPAATLCRAMLDQLDGQQAAEYARLVAANPKLRVFFRGWMSRRIGNVDRARCGRAPPAR